MCGWRVRSDLGLGGIFAVVCDVLLGRHLGGRFLQGDGYQYRTNARRGGSGRSFGDVFSADAMIPLLSPSDAVCYLNGIGLLLSI